MVSEEMILAGRADRARRVGAWLGLALGGVVLVGLTYRGLTRALGPEEERGVPAFEIVPLARGDLRRTVVATGHIEPRSRVQTRSEVSGVVRVVHVEEGDRVARGAPMFDLDRAPLEDRVQARRAALEVKRAAARYDLETRARLELERRSRDHARVTRLLEKGVVSRARFEESLHAVRLAEVDLGDARAEVAAREAAVREAEHLLSQAERDLERSVIRAPIDGLLVERHVDIGAVVADVSAAGGTLLAVVVDDRRIRLVAEVDEAEIAPVRVGQVAEVTVDAFPAETFEGTVSKVSASGTEEDDVSNFEIEIELPEDERLRVGMSADARVVVGRHADALLVPNTALVRTTGGVAIRVRDPDTDRGFRSVPVREVYSDGFFSAIEGAVTEGASVLVPERRGAS